MQKVVGSNPISRFFAIALHVGGLVSALKPETKWNHPRISPPFWALGVLPTHVVNAADRRPVSQRAMRATPVVIAKEGWHGSGPLG
jgi:hypothetical protein